MQFHFTLVGGPCSSGQLTGRPAGTRAVYTGHWCAKDTLADLSPPHLDGAQPIVRRPQGTPFHGRQWNSLDSTGDLQALGHILHSSAFTGCATREPPVPGLWQ
ncbi:UNVERIFIED_CONTAM: hypothetical protein FKN15_023792 [Acipenser sinensis]